MKLFLLFGMAVIHFSSIAQINRKQWMIGGNGLISYSKSKELKNSTIQFSPSAGYFFLDKFVGGLRLGLTSETQEFQANRFRNSTKSISPFLRYYILPVEQRINYFIESSYGYSWSKYKNFTYPASHKYKGYNISILTGPSFFLNERTAFELNIGYNYLSRGPIDTSVTHKILIGFGLQVYIGKNHN